MSPGWKGERTTDAGKYAEAPIFQRTLRGLNHFLRSRATIIVPFNDKLRSSTRHEMRSGSGGVLTFSTWINVFGLTRP